MLQRSLSSQERSSANFRSRFSFKNGDVLAAFHRLSGSARDELDDNRSGTDVVWAFGADPMYGVIKLIFTFRQQA